MNLLNELGSFLDRAKAQLTEDEKGQGFFLANLHLAGSEGCLYMYEGDAENARCVYREHPIPDELDVLLHATLFRAVGELLPHDAKDLIDGRYERRLTLSLRIYSDGRPMELLAARWGSDVSHAFVFVLRSLDVGAMVAMN